MSNFPHAVPLCLSAPFRVAIEWRRERERWNRYLATRFAELHPWTCLLDEAERLMERHPWARTFDEVEQAVSLERITPDTLPEDWSSSTR